MKAVILLALITSNFYLSANQMQNSDTIKSNRFFQSGLQKLHEKKYSEAIADFTGAIKQNKKNWRAYRLRADAEDGLYDYKASIEDYTMALHLNPSDTLSYHGRAEAKRLSSDGKGAIEDYNIALSWNPRDTFLRFGRALCLYHCGQYESSIEDLNIFLNEWIKTTDELYTTALLIRGYSYSLNHEFEKSIKDFKKCFKLGYSQKAAFMNLGRAYYYLKDRNPLYLDSAIESYKIAAPTYPDVFESFYYLGQAYADKGDYKLSEEYLQKALAVNPNHIDALFIFITVKVRQRKFDEGYDLFKKYLGLTKELKEGVEYLYLGIAKWGAKQDTIGAVQDFEMASKLGGITKGVFDNQLLLLLGNPKYALSMKKYITDEMSRTSDSLRLSYLLVCRSLMNNQLNDIVGMQADLENAKLLAIRNPAVYLVTGTLRKSLNLSPEVVLKNYDKAFEVNGNLWEAHMMKAYFYGEHKDFKKSCENLSKAKELSAPITISLKDYMCNGVSLRKANESELRFVIYPYITNVILKFN